MPVEVLLDGREETTDNGLRFFMWEHRFGSPSKMYSGWEAAPSGMTFDHGFAWMADRIRHKAKAILEEYNPGMVFAVRLSRDGKVWP